MASIQIAATWHQRENTKRIFSTNWLWFSWATLYPKADLKFNIKPSIFKILPTFEGEVNEEPYEHLYDFILICKTNNTSGLTQDGLRLRLFSLTLKGTAKKCIFHQRAFFSWADMQNTFVTRFYQTTTFRARDYEHLWPIVYPEEEEDVKFYILFCQISMERWMKNHPIIFMTSI